MNRLVLAGPIALLALAACNGEKDAAGEGLEIIEIGEKAIDGDGYTGDIEVEIPEGATSALVHCGEAGDSALGAAWFVTDPGGDKVHDGDNPGDKFRSDFVDDTVAALVPVTPNLDISAGKWLFNFYFEGAGSSVDCGAVIRTDAVSAKPEVKVRLVFVKVPGLDETTAKEDANFQAAIDEFTTIWGTAGLKPTFEYVAFDGSADTYGVVDVTDEDMGEFNDLLRTVDPDDSRSVTFFLVEEIANSSAGGATILGLSGGPPGAAAVPKTSKSGVVVSTIDIAEAPSDVARIMAHEGGHFLGMFHTSEKTGDSFDILDDTPECPISNDANTNGTVNSDECGGKGAENIMWWTLSPDDAPSFSDDQSFVLARSPAVK